MENNLDYETPCLFELNLGNVAFAQGTSPDPDNDQDPTSGSSGDDDEG